LWTADKQLYQAAQENDMAWVSHASEVRSLNLLDDYLGRILSLRSLHIANLKDFRCLSHRHNRTFRDIDKAKLTFKNGHFFEAQYPQK
jgi:hypothetical protein